MKILLDHNIPHALRPLFPDEHEVYTTHYLGWSEYEDEQFLTATVDESFSVIVTLDRGLPHQQQVAAYDVGLIVLAVHPATPDHLQAHMDRVIESLPVAASKQQVVVLE